MKMSRERARRAADQRKAEDDLSSLTSYWSNTVLTGAHFVSIHRINLAILAIGFTPSYQPFPPQTGNVSGNQREPSGYGGEGCRPPSEEKFGGSLSTTPSTSPLSSTPYSGRVFYIVVAHHDVKSCCRLNQNDDSPLCRTRAHSANESKETLQLVSLDVSRTFPQLGIFQVLPFSLSSIFSIKSCLVSTETVFRRGVPTTRHCETYWALTFATDQTLVMFR